VRTSDKKEFRVVVHSHWSDIEACDGSGETDHVKWSGEGLNEPEHYVSHSKGHGYDVKPR